MYRLGFGNKHENVISGYRIFSWFPGIRQREDEILQILLNIIKSDLFHFGID